MKKVVCLIALLFFLSYPINAYCKKDTEIKYTFSGRSESDPNITASAIIEPWISSDINLQIDITLTNRSSSFIEFNFFADNYIVVDDENRTYKCTWQVISYPGGALSPIAAKKYRVYCLGTPARKIKELIITVNFCKDKIILKSMK